MRIDGLSERPRVQPSTPRSTPVRSGRQAREAGDVVELSKGAQDVAGLSALANAAEVEPNPRLAQIRERVNQGYYDTPAVRQQVADAVLGSGSMDQTVRDAAQVMVARQQMEEVPEVRPDRVAASRERVGTGFYDTPAARQQTASRVLDNLA
jgi:hypothetical protein